MASPDMQLPHTRDYVPSLAAMAVTAYFVGVTLAILFPGNSQSAASALFGIVAYFILMGLLQLGMWIAVRRDRRKRSLGSFTVPGYFDEAVQEMRSAREHMAGAFSVEYKPTLRERVGMKLFPERSTGLTNYPAGHFGTWATDILHVNTEATLSWRDWLRLLISRKIVVRASIGCETCPGKTEGRSVCFVKAPRAFSR